ncbi:MAG: transporter related, partial [Ramlibacter sp.]|nr:transporter related [Ramlibacter sp.]
MTPILEVIDLGVAFGGIRAVDGVSFAAEQNAITTIIGPNGAGKSTLFNLISGMIRPNAGRVILGGGDRTGFPPHLMQRAGLGRSFQITNLFFELTVFENLRLAAQRLEPTRRFLLPAGKSDCALARVGDLIDRFGLQAKIGELAGALSHGEQRRLEIAVALAAKPSILLLDEPTQGMSRADTAETAQLIRDLSRDVTILLIEHDIGVVMNISSHIVVMHQGRKLAEG